MVESDDEVDEFQHKSITFGTYKELIDNEDHLLSMQPWYCEYQSDNDEEDEKKDFLKIAQREKAA